MFPKAKSIHLVGTDRPEATMIYSGFFNEVTKQNRKNILTNILIIKIWNIPRSKLVIQILAANPLNPVKLTLVSPDPANQQLAQVHFTGIYFVWNCTVHSTPIKNERTMTPTKLIYNFMFYVFRIVLRPRPCWFTRGASWPPGVASTTISGTSKYGLRIEIQEFN